MAGLTATGANARKSLGNILRDVQRNPALLDRDAALRLGEYPDRENFADEQPGRYRIVASHQEIPTVVLIVLAIARTEAPRLGILDVTSGCCMVITMDQLIEETFHRGRSAEYTMQAAAVLAFAASGLVGA